MVVVLAVVAVVAVVAVENDDDGHDGQEAAGTTVVPCGGSIRRLSRCVQCTLSVRLFLVTATCRVSERERDT